ncbi:tyrosine-type recombinase/integrase [Endozoicomonadaceae bacterium StTr2]
MSQQKKIKFTKKLLSSLPVQDKPYFVYDVAGNGLRLRVAPSGTKSFQVLKRVSSKIKFVTIGKFCDASGRMQLHPEQAQKNARNIYGDLSDGVDVTEKKREQRKEEQRQQSITLGAFIENRYKPWALQHHNSAAKTLSEMKNHFGKWFDKPMTDINPWLVGTWRTAELKKGRKPTGINRKAGALRGILSRAVEWQVLDTHPLAGMKPLKIDKRPKKRYLSPEEERRLRAALDARQEAQRKDRASFNQWREARKKPLLDTLDCSYTDYLKPLVLIALNTGLRRGELFQLTWHDINLKGRTLTVEGEGAKSGQTRHIPLNDEAFAVLVAWRNQTDSEELVFPNPNTGKPFDNIQTSWEKILVDAELSFPKGHPKRFTFHDLRHTFASNLVMKGASIFDVQQLLGHESTDTTMVYAHLAPEHKAQVVALLNK